MSERKVSLNRTVLLKTTMASDDYQKLHDRHKIVLSVQKDLLSEIISYGNDSVYYEDQEIDLTQKREDLYELTNKSITFERFEKLLKVVYKAVILGGSNSPRTLFSLFLSLPSETAICPFDNETNALLNRIDEVTSYADLKDIIKATKKEFVDIGFFRYHNLDLKAGEKFTIMANVCATIKSWIFQDQTCIETYQMEEDQIQEKMPEFQQYLPFMDHCIENNYTKTFNHKVGSHIIDCLLPAIRDNQEPSSLFWRTSRGKQHRFSLHEGVKKFLKENPYTHDIPRETFEWFNLIQKHKLTKKRANFPFLQDGDFDRVYYKLGKNYSNINWIIEGETIEKNIVYEEKEYTEAIKAEHILLKIRDLGVQMRLHTKDKYHNGVFNPSPYFKDPIVWQTKDNPNTIIVEFTKHGQRIICAIKEPSLCMKGDEYHMFSPFTVENDYHEHHLDTVRYLLSTALPNKDNGEEHKKDSIERFEKVKGKTVRVLGIDYGQTFPFAYSVSESVIDGSYSKPTVLKTGLCQGDNTIRDKYHLLLRDIYAGIDYIKYTNQLDSTRINHTEKLNRFSQLLLDMKDYFQNRDNNFQADTNLLYSIENPVEHLKSLLETHQPQDLKLQHGWMGYWAHKYLSLKFKETKILRSQHCKRGDNIDQKFNNDFLWLKCIQAMKKLKKSLSYLGTDNDRTPIETKELSRYFKNVQENFMKQMTSQIVKTAKDNNCQFIVLEELDWGDDNTKRDNELTALWSPKAFVEKVENASMWFNIRVVTVDPNHTSQVHYETDSFGYRQGETLYYEQDGVIKTTHADINASKNIAGRFLMRHKNRYKVAIGKYSGATVKKSDKTDRRNTGKLIDDFKTLKNAKGFFTQEKFKGLYSAYIHKGEYITDDELKQYRKTLAERIN
jgi:IS605 OrfB family transposase